MQFDPKNKFFNRFTLFGKLLRLPFKIIPKEAVLMIFSGPLKRYLWIKGSHNLSILFGKYEKEQTKEFIQVAKKCSCFYDLGAHVGYYTLLFHSVQKAGESYAFEPSPINFSYLKEHIKVNNIHQVKLEQKAVSDNNGLLKFKQTRSHVAGKIADDGEIEVDVIKLSDFIYKNKEPDLIKMDIEGEEIKVLEDIKEILENFKPAIFLSTHGENVHQECIKFLKDLEYKLIPLNSPDIKTAREIMCK